MAEELTALAVMAMTDEQIYDGFAAIAQAQSDVVAWSQKLEVKDPDSLRDAQQLLRDIRAVKEKVKERVDQLNAPLEERTKYVKEQAKGTLNPFDNSEAMVKAKVVSYNAKKDEEARAEQAKIRAQQEELRRKEEARRKEAEAAEDARQVAEAKRVADLRAKEEAAKKKGVAAQLEAEAKRKEEEARIERERAERDRLQKEQEAIDQQAAEQRDRELYAQQVKATAAGKTKGVQKRWTYEILDDALVPREYCDPSPKKLNAVVQAGIREIPGVHVYQKMTTTLAGGN